MRELTVKIAHQSKVILILAKVARIILFVLLGLTILMLISTWVPGDQPIFSIGGTEVFATIPLRTLLGTQAYDQVKQLVDTRIDLSVQMVTLILALVMLKIVTRLFTRIRESENPFTQGVVKAIKGLAVMLGLLVGINNSILGVVVAFVLFTFALIFQYGLELQTQVDETL